jgi:hypothetical protein
MRIHDDRYQRDQLRHDVALAFIRHEARTHTIRVWTGLTDDRIRKLYRSYIKSAPGIGPVRHRGKSPQQPGFFTRSARARQESSVLASMYRNVGILPRSTTPEAVRSLAGPARGRLLCQAYEMYRGEFSSPLISFERAEFLLRALWRRDELALAACRECTALLVTDRWYMRAPSCSVCAPPGGMGNGLEPGNT